jgi:hypothetical protein
MATRRGPDNSVRVAISGKNIGNNWANIFHCQLTTSGSIAQADLDTWLNSFQAQYKTSFAARQNSNATYLLATATLYTPGGGVLQSTFTMTGTGSKGGTAVLDSSMCKVVSWLTTVYWRGGKPRTYLPGIETVDLAASSGSTLANAEITALQTAAAGFRTAINALTATSITGTTLGFVSFTTGNVVRPTPLFFAFTGAKVHSRAGTQRRRMGKWAV